MSNVDPRLELARQIAATRRPVVAANTPVGPKTTGPRPSQMSPETRQLQSQVEDATTVALRQYPNLSEQIKAASQGRPQATGIKGMFGKLLSSTPAKIALQPLIVLDTGRRAVISTAREMVDLLDTDPNTKASISDFVAQTKDPMFGFGTAFPMKGNWGRFTGFVGDVALDPITYMTLGVGRAAQGVAGRIALAGKYLDKFGDAAKAASIAQRGKAVLSADEIAKLGLNRSGIYMFGTKIRIPMTGAIGESMLSGVTRARLGFTNTRFGSTLQKGFMGLGGDGNKSLRDIRLALARGEQLPDNMAVDAGIRIVNSENSRRAAAKMASDAVRRRMAQELSTVGRENLESYRNVAYKWLEGTAVPQTAQEVAFFERFKTLFSDLWDDVDSDFRRLTPDSEGMNRVKEYFPWVMTDAAKEATTDMQTPWVKNLMSTLAPNPLDRVGSFRSRGLKEGAEFLWTLDDNGKQIPYILKSTDLNVDRINQISRGALGIDFFETDIERALFSYANSYSQQKGLLAMYEDLSKSGLLREMSRRAVIDEEAALAVSAAADNAVRGVVAGLGSASKRLEDAFRLVSKRAEVEVKRLATAADDAAKGLVLAENAASDVAQAGLLSQALDAATIVSTIRDEIDGLKGSLDFLFDEVPPEVGALYDKYDDLSRSLGSLTDEINALQAERVMLEQGIASPMTADVLTSLQRRFNEASSALKDAATNHQFFLELNSVLRSRFDDIIDGTTPKGLGRVGAIIKGSQRALPAKEGAAKSVEDFAESPGVFQKWAKSKDGPLEGQEWFAKTQGFIGNKNLNKTGISRLSYKGVLESVVRAAPTHQNGIELIQSAVYMLARDLKFHGADNAVLAPVREALVQDLDKVAKVVGLVENRGAAILSDAQLSALKTEIDTNYAALNNLYDIRSYRLDMEEALKQAENFVSIRGVTAVPAEDDFVFFSDVAQNYINGLYDANGDFPSYAEIARAMRGTVDSMSESTVLGHGNKTYGIYDIPDLEKLVNSKELLLNKAVDGRIPGGLRGLDVNKLIENIGPAVGDLADRLAQYTLASEVQRRFTALGKELAMFGLAPTEEMYSIVMRRVGEEFLNVTMARESAVLAARGEMDKIRAAVMMDIGAKGNWAATFTKMLEEAYAGPNGSALEEILGPIVQFTPDAPRMKSKYAAIKAKSGRAEYLDESKKFAKEMQKALGEEVDNKITFAETKKLLARLADTENPLTPDDFADVIEQADVEKFRTKAIELLDADKATSTPTRDFINEEWSEWFEASFPGRKFSIASAEQQARLSPVTSEKRMRIFFNELLGGHYRSEASYLEKVGRNRWSRKGFVSKIANKSPSGEYIAVQVQGSLQTELSVLGERIGHLHRMIDPSADYRAFLNDPFGLGGGPLSTADFLESLAKRLEDDIREIPKSVRTQIGKAEAAAPKAESARDALKRSVELMNPRGSGESVKDYSARVQGLLDEMDPTNVRPFVAPTREEVIQPFVVPPKKAKESYKAYEARVERMRKNWERSQEPVYARKVKEAQDAWRASIDEEIGGLAKFYEKQAKMAEDFAEVRAVRAERDRLVNSPEYVIAERDRDLTQMIKGLSDVNGWEARHPVTGEQGWFIQAADPGVSFEGLLSSLTDQRLRRDLLAAQPQIRVMRQVNVDELAGAELDGVFLVSPDKSVVLPYTKDEMNALRKRINADRAEIRDFERAGGTSADGVTTERYLYIQNLKKEVADYDNGNYTFVKFGAFDGKKKYSIDDLIILGDNPRGGTAAPVRKALPELFERFGSIKATMVDAESLAQRKVVADMLMQNGVIDRQVYRRLTTEGESINSVLSSKIYNESVGEVTVESLIGPEAARALRDVDKPLTFTKEEWLALYEPLDAKRMGEVARQTSAASKRLAEFKALRDRGQQTVTINGERFVVAKEIESLTAELDGLRTLAKTGSIAPGQAPVALQSALEKMDQLFAQIGEDAIGQPRRLANRVGSIKTNTFGSSRVGGKAFKDARNRAIDARWEKTSSFATLSKVKEIDASPAMARFNQTETAASNAAAAAAQARQHAIDLRSTIAPQEQDIMEIMRIASRDIETFSKEGVEIFNEVSRIVKGLVDTSPDGVKTLNLQNISLRIPETVKAAAREIRSQYVSPAERDFVTAIAGTSVREDLYRAAMDAARAKTAFSAFEAVVAGDVNRIDEIVTILNPARGRQAALRKGKPPVSPTELQNPVLARQYLLSKIDDVTKQIQSITKTSRKQFDAKFAAVIKNVDVKEKKLAEALARFTEIQGRYDSIIPNLYSAEATAAYADTFIKPRIDELTDILTRAQAVGVGARKKIVTPENYMDIVEIVDDFKTVMNDLAIAPDDPIQKAFLDVVNANAEMMGRLVTAGQLSSEFMGTANFTNFERVLSEGYASLEKAGLKGIEAPGEVVDFFDNMRRLKEPMLQREVLNFLQKYTKFFKSYATLSPGFHVRNAMSNTFALVAAGANPARFAKGLGIYRSMREALESGVTLEQWLATLPEAERAVADIAARSMFASGGGITSEAFRGMSKRNKGVLGAFEDNFLLSGSRSIGGRLESSSRFILGYDSALNGLDFNQASARVRRYMVDYEDVGAADEVIRVIIPFWMWTSRALPVHMVNQWLNPRPYAIYQSFKRNLTGEDEGQITPSWITEQGGFRVSGNTYLMPDLGFNRLGQQVAQLGDLPRLLSQANPLIRLPIELAGDRKLYTGQQFKDEPVEVSGGVAALLQPLLQIAGYGQTAPDGRQFVDEKALYALQNLVPFLAQGERLLPSTEGGQERQMQAWASYFGAPVRNVTERQQQGELYSRLRELQNVTNQGKAMEG